MNRIQILFGDKVYAGKISKELRDEKGIQLYVLKKQ